MSNTNPNCAMLLVYKKGLSSDAIKNMTGILGQKSVNAFVQRGYYGKVKEKVEIDINTFPEHYIPVLVKTVFDTYKNYERLVVWVPTDTDLGLSSPLGKLSELENVDIMNYNLTINKS